ncbi:MAG TPA: FGGY family carbohydrate kinase, partial [Nitrospiria bacterium]|nr:FGGY family carbohydrate kinase [Nitrospiria bacterium]
MEDYILALDQGTTSCRALLFDRKGRIISTAQKEFTQYFPQPGWVEHDPEEIWAVQSGMASEALARKGVRPAQVKAIG